MFKYFFQIVFFFFFSSALASLGTKEALTQFKNIKTFTSYILIINNIKTNHKSWKYLCVLIVVFLFLPQWTHLSELVERDT